MKLLLIFFFGMISTNVFCQFKWSPNDSIPGKIPNKKVYRFSPGFKADSLFSSQLYKQRLTPGIYNLPQDNMPCIVPDTKDVAAIPNPYPVTIPYKGGKMPNPSPYLRKNTPAVPDVK